MAVLVGDERQARRNFRVRRDVLNEYSDSELLKRGNIISLPVDLSSDSVSSSTPDVLENFEGQARVLRAT